MLLELLSSKEGELEELFAESVIQKKGTQQERDIFQKEHIKKGLTTHHETPNMAERKAHYVLKCTACGAEYEDKPGEWRLRCDGEGTVHGPALLRSVFAAPDPRDCEHADVAGTTAAFAPWLAHRSADGTVPAVLRTTSLPACYRSTHFGARLGLRRLWVAFCGFWPERGATLASCAFKELEAACIAARLEGLPRGTGVVVASAGNTARAFAQIFSRPGLARPVVIVVPAAALPALWSPAPFAPRVTLVAVAGGDYADATRLADFLAAQAPYLLVPEGGARNNARRDGMSLALLAAASAAAAAADDDEDEEKDAGDETKTKNRNNPIPIPQHYFQAVGSGTGGIAAWEAAQRLVEQHKGTPSPSVTRLHLSQNAPFAPMVDAWEEGGHARALPAYCDSERESKARIAEVGAFVLTNRRPPYAIGGGVHDALRATDGTMHAVTNAEAAAAAALFEADEGIDVDPAAAVAVAHLCHAARTGLVQPDDLVVLNVTGGGKKRLFATHTIHHLEPAVTVDAADISPETASRIADTLRQQW